MRKKKGVETVHRERGGGLRKDPYYQIIVYGEGGFKRCVCPLARKSWWWVKIEETDENGTGSADEEGSRQLKQPSAREAIRKGGREVGFGGWGGAEGTYR